MRRFSLYRRIGMTTPDFGIPRQKRTSQPSQPESERWHCLQRGLGTFSVRFVCAYDVHNAEAAETQENER